MRLHPFALLPLLLLAACGGDDSVTPPPRPPSTPPRYAPTSATLLSTGNPTKDEDPSVLLANDGSIVVAWFSDRTGNGDIYIARCTEDTTWSAPVRVTTSGDGDFYPNIIQDANGVYRLTWFRWHDLYRGNIWYNESMDPLSWNTANEKQVTTTADVDDWVPSIAQTPDSLRIFFASSERDSSFNTKDSDIYYASSPVDTVAFGPVRRFQHNVNFYHDHLPFAAWTGSRLDVIWVRHDMSQTAPWISPPPQAELCYSFSPDGGATWAGEFPITEFGPVHVFPAFYQRSDSEWRLLWMTNRSGPAQVVELPLLQLFSYPSALIVNDKVGAGYSHRVARTPVNGLYFGAWVQGPDGTQDIYYRFYKD